MLLITYTFPPVGGAGVQRVAKFVKYLPRHDWDVSVLTVANPSVPLFDLSLQKDIPPETVIRRARSWEPGYAVKAAVGSPGGLRGRAGPVKQYLSRAARALGSFVLQPDPQVLWMPAAVAAGRRLARDYRHDAVLASGPPFSVFLVAARLARHAGLPFVLDYRDEWSISNEFWENKRLDPLSKVIQSRMQRRVMRRAHGLIASTRSSAKALDGLHRTAGGRARVTWIYNGFDPDDFAPDRAATPPVAGRFRLVYVGTLWNLTSVEPLVKAVRMLSGSHPDLAARLDLVFAGRRVGPQAELLASLRGLPCGLTEHPYLDHDSAVGLMRGSDVLCLLLSDLPGVGRVVPAKLFEYLATNRPILTIAPPGETWELLEGYPKGKRFVPGNVDGIRSWLEEAIRSKCDGVPQKDDAWDVSAYTRDSEARQLARFLDTACG